MHKCGYSTIEQLDIDIDKTWAAFIYCEEQYPPGDNTNIDRKFFDVGIIRTILYIINDDFLNSHHSDNSIRAQQIKDSRKILNN